VKRLYKKFKRKAWKFFSRRFNFVHEQSWRDALQWCADEQEKVYKLRDEVRVLMNENDFLRKQVSSFSEEHRMCEQIEEEKGWLAVYHLADQKGEVLCGTPAKLLNSPVTYWGRNSQEIPYKFCEICEEKR
jgi:hypothetical protein